MNWLIVLSLQDYLNKNYERLFASSPIKHLELAKVSDRSDITNFVIFENNEVIPKYFLKVSRDKSTSKILQNEYGIHELVYKYSRKCKEIYVNQYFMILDGDME